jgi:hypothetical protein
MNVSWVITDAGQGAFALLQAMQDPTPAGLAHELDRAAGLCSLDAATSMESERRDLLDSVVGLMRTSCVPWRPLSAAEREKMDTCVAMLRHLVRNS